MEQLTGTTAEALGWKAIAELVRRHPQRLWVAASGDGRVTSYDMAKPGAPLISFDLTNDQVHSLVGSGFATTWSALYDQEKDPRTWLAELELSANLRPRDGGNPAVTPSSLSVRVASQFLLATLGTRERWVAGGSSRWSRPGELVVDGSATDGGHEPILLGKLHDDHPTLALTATGEAWLPGGRSVDLLGAHAATSTLTALTAFVLGAWLP